MLERFREGACVRACGGFGFTAINRLPGAGINPSSPDLRFVGAIERGCVRGLRVHGDKSPPGGGDKSQQSGWNRLHMGAGLGSLRT